MPQSELLVGKKKKVVDSWVEVVKTVEKIIAIDYYSKSVIW